MLKSVPNFTLKQTNINIFLGVDLFHFFRDAFTININLVSDEKSAENKGLEANKQTSVL